MPGVGGVGGEFDDEVDDGQEDGDADADGDFDIDPDDPFASPRPAKYKAKSASDAAKATHKNGRPTLAYLQSLSVRPNIYTTLANSLAPSIWEMDDVKKGILLQLFGGTNKVVNRSGGGGGGAGAGG